MQTSLECATYRGRFVNDGHGILISEQSTELNNFEFYRIEQNCVEAFSYSVRLCMIMCSTKHVTGYLNMLNTGCNVE